MDLVGRSELLQTSVARMATRSASSSASSWSWVTNTVVWPVRCGHRAATVGGLSHLRIQSPEGLVQEQHPGFDRQRPRERHALALAARELGRNRRSSPGS